MKKRLIAVLLLLLCVSMALAPAALAVSISDVHIVLKPEAMDGKYVRDLTLLLSESEREELERSAAEVSEEYGCGVYVILVHSWRDYYPQYNYIWSAAEAFYKDCDLGFGSEKSGVLLLLSMSGRDYDIAAYGYGNTAFTDYGKEILAEKFLDNFKRDDWDGGIVDYIKQSGVMLKQAREGNPLDVNNRGLHGVIREFRQELGPVGLFLVIIVLPCLIALIVCRKEQKKLKSVAKAANAEFFAVPNSLQLYASEDVFSHVTETRVRIESDSDRGGGGGGGTSVNSGGFSHSSGKF